MWCNLLVEGESYSLGVFQVLSTGQKWQPFSKLKDVLHNSVQRARLSHVKRKRNW